MPKLLKTLATVLAALLAFIAAPALAAVELAFHSYEMDVSGSDVRFPHAFVTLKGQLDGGGSPIDANYGFTARAISPAILFGSVKGMMHAAPPAYLARSDRRFALTLTDAQYEAVRQRILAWRAEGLTYNLDRRNCVHFVREVARAAGLSVREDGKLMRKPRSFLQDLAARNPGVSAASMAGQSPR